MTWTWDAVWKVLQPQPKCSGMVCSLASGRISANFPKSKDVSVVVTMWMWSHMPIHNLRRCSNTSYKYARTQDKVWKVQQLQPKLSGMVCTLASGRISPNSHKSWVTSVVVLVWVWSHMPIHNLWMVLKHLILVCQGHGMQFIRFYGDVVALFPHFQ